MARTLVEEGLVMASYPGPNVHRHSRRKLSRGQYPQVTAGIMSPTAVVAVVTIDWSEPVVVSGNIDLNLSRVSPAAPVLLSQTVVSSLQVTQTYASTVVGCDWSYLGGTGAVRTAQGGAVAAAAGTF